MGAKVRWRLFFILEGLVYKFIYFLGREAWKLRTAPNFQTNVAFLIILEREFYVFFSFLFLAM